MRTKKQQQDELENNIEENVELSKEVRDQLTKAFQKVITSPEIDRIKAYQIFEATVLAEWAAQVYKNISEDLNSYVSNGRLFAKEQLENKGYKLKSGSPEEIKKILYVQRQNAKQNINKLVSGIKSYSRNIMSEILEGQVLNQKRLSKFTLDTIESYGIALFFDAGGKRWSLDRYMEMYTTTVLLSAQREAFFSESVYQGNDLVKVIHLGITPECPLCEPFTGKVLSISGKSKDYMSVSDASQTGHLFGVNCDHIGQLELAPNKEEDDNIVHLTDENLKYMQRKGYRIRDIKRKPYFAM